VVCPSTTENAVPVRLPSSCSVRITGVRTFAAEWYRTLISAVPPGALPGRGQAGNSGGPSSARSTRRSSRCEAAPCASQAKAPVCESIGSSLRRKFG
jgi:hypothetical protein